VAAIPGTPALRRLRQKDESKAGPAATEWDHLRRQKAH
jgi:hypothetical protein